jgi:hypothetical protein
MARVALQSPTPRFMNMKVVDECQYQQQCHSQVVEEGDDHPQTPTIRPLHESNGFEERKVSTIEKKNKRKTRASSCFPLNSSKVCFGTVQIVEFPVTIGDHPEVQDGCPIALSPVPIKHHDVIPLQAYERDRHLQREKSKDALRLTSVQREDRLLNAGFSHEEIKGAASLARQVRIRRGRSFKLINWGGVHSLVEKTTRGIRKILPTARAESSQL